jgi:hypothetical protein
VKRYRILTRSGPQRTNGHHKTYMIGVPWHLAEALPSGQEYEAELTEDGLLFRPVSGPVLAPVVDLPSWARS